MVKVQSALLMLPYGKAVVVTCLEVFTHDVIFCMKCCLLIWEYVPERQHVPTHDRPHRYYSTVSGPIRLVISLECFIEITPDFLCPFMND